MTGIPMLKRYERPAEYACHVIRDVMVPMRDGVLLATDIYLPAKNGRPVKGKFPAILGRTPYDKSNFTSGAIFKPVFFAERGYAIVRQDVRGRYKSQGEFYPYINEGPDGYDTIEWIAEQPWSDGIVGTEGLSYSGAVQEALATERPPHLRAMFIGGGSTNYHMDTEGTGGAFRAAHNLMYTFYLAMNMEETATGAGCRAWLAECEKNAGQWLKRPLSKQISIFEGLPLVQKWYADWIAHQDFDEYWKQKGYCAEGRYDEYPDIPIYRLAGNYDQYSISSMVSHIALTKINKSPNFLQYGPWVHAECGDAEFGIEHPTNDRRERMRDEQLRFFDQFLKGLETGLLDEPKVKIFVMGGGEGTKSNQGRLVHGGGWRFEEAWPLLQTDYTKYYLQTGGGLGRSKPELDDSASSYSYDPADPVPTIGGPYAYPRDESGPRDQLCRIGLFGCKDNLPISSRTDVLSFVTPPLAEDVYIVGPVTVQLWASSSAVDTDFTAKLIDQYPPSNDYPHGYALGLIDSIIRARYRDSFEKAVLMEPGKIYAFTVDLWQVSNRFKAGHRIRLDISSSNFPAFDVNPNTGEDIGYHTRTVVAHNTIYHDPEHPSHIVLPIIPVKR